MSGKVCTKCNQLKSFEEYQKRTTSKDGHRNECKQCRTIISKKWYMNTIEDRHIQGRAFHQQHREADLERNRQWYQNNKEYRREYKQAYYREKCSTDLNFKVKSLITTQEAEAQCTISVTVIALLCHSM